MEHIPFQYKNENYILLFCKKRDIIQKILEKNEKHETYVNILKPDIEKNMIESPYIFEEYLDSLNEEEFIRKCKYILYMNEEKIENENLWNLIEKYGKRMYIGNDYVEEEIAKLGEDDYALHIQKCKEMNERLISTKIIYEEEKKRIDKKIQDPTQHETHHIEGIHMITYIRRMEGNDLYFQLQIKCILENYKSKYIENMVVIGKDVEDTFQKIQFERIEGKKLILINDDDDNITFQDLMIISNELFANKVVMILRSDIIFLQNEEIQSVLYDFLMEDKKMYCFTRIERDFQGKFVRIPPNQNIFGSVEQDSWIFKAPIQCMSGENVECIKEYDFNERFSELYMNYYMRGLGYELVNDIRQFKFIRVTIHPNLEQRDLIKNPKKVKQEKIYLLPEVGILENITIDQLVLSTGKSEEDLYELKKEMVNRYFGKYLE